VWLQLSKSCTGYQSPRGSSTSCACWFTSRFWNTRWNTSQTFWCWMPKFRVDLCYAPHHVTISSTNQRQSFFCCCTTSMEQAVDGAETAAINGLVSLWSENISVWFCLRAPGYRLTLWCTLGLLVGDAIQVLQLQLQLIICMCVVWLRNVISCQGDMCRFICFNLA